MAMEKYIFITDQDRELCGCIKKIFAENNFKIATAYDPGTISLQKSPNKNIAEFPWNMLSAVSAKNTVLQASAEEDFYTALMIFPSEEKMSFISSSSTMAIQEKTDINIKSRLFMLKELTNYFIRIKRGRIFMIFQGPSDSDPYTAFFKTYIKSWKRYQGVPILNGIENKKMDPRKFASFVFKIVSGRGKEKQGGYFSPSIFKTAASPVKYDLSLFKTFYKTFSEKILKKINFKKKK